MVSKKKKSYSVWKVYDIIRKDPKDFFMTMLFDVLFVASLVIISNVWNSILPTQGDPGFRDFAISYGWHIMGGLVLTYFIMLLSYSFFKYMTLNRINNYFLWMMLCRP